MYMKIVLCNRRLLMNKPRFLGEGKPVKQFDSLIWITLIGITVPHCVPYSGIADLSDSISVD